MIEGYRTRIRGNGYEMLICHLPQRKKPCLMMTSKDSYKYRKVASFNSEEDADWFIEQLVGLIGQVSEVTP